MELLFNQLYALHASLIDHSTDVYSAFAGLPPDDQPFTSRWGSGEDFYEEEIRDLGKHIDAHSEAIDLGTGDLLIIDNFRWGHGREPYAGDREIMVAMSPAVSRQTAHVPDCLRMMS